MVGHCIIFKFQVYPWDSKQNFEIIVPFVFQVDWISAEKIQK
jgi:hypothetical protein